MLEERRYSWLLATLLGLELQGRADIRITGIATLAAAGPGQISFYQLTTEADSPYGSASAGSKYQGQRGPTPSRVHEDFS